MGGWAGPGGWIRREYRHSISGSGAPFNQMILNPVEINKTRVGGKSSPRTFPFMSPVLGQDQALSKRSGRDLEVIMDTQVQKTSVG